MPDLLFSVSQESHCKLDLTQGDPANVLEEDQSLLHWYGSKFITLQTFALKEGQPFKICKTVPENLKGLHKLQGIGLSTRKVSSRP